ncbi:anti-sigma factor family protein [Corynebacterium cystitidis]|uniref:anti-sigma factor family protein n=1 Tax=Corynebacterium cystitidis TaxID=35757 RepID=UPI00211E6B64|nr:anti-sigma factor [Corynebacterium cystitidis]
MTAKKPVPMRRSLRRRLRLEISSIDHLSPEAVTAFVDGEMSEGAQHRVRVHIVHCPQCREEVHTQRFAAEIVRGSNVEEGVRAPSGLVERLAQIALDPEAQQARNKPLHSPVDQAREGIENGMRSLFRRG